jgi:hypothetical protein
VSRGPPSNHPRPDTQQGEAQRRGYGEFAMSERPLPSGAMRADEIYVQQIIQEIDGRGDQRHEHRGGESCQQYGRLPARGRQTSTVAPCARGTCRLCNPLHNQSVRRDRPACGSRRAWAVLEVGATARRNDRIRQVQMASDAPDMSPMARARQDDGTAFAPRLLDEIQHFSAIGRRAGSMGSRRAAIVLATARPRSSHSTSSVSEARRRTARYGQSLAVICRRVSASYPHR